MTKGEPQKVRCIEDAKLLARAVADRDMPCPKCSYNVRGIESDKCPECGARLALRLAVGDTYLPYKGPWFVAILGIAVPLVDIALRAMHVTSHSSRRHFPGAVELWIVTACLSMALVLVIARRNWFGSKSRLWQWRTAVATCMLMSLLLALLLENRRLGPIARLIFEFLSEAGRLFFALTT